jgi:hypothetical protein
MTCKLCTSKNFVTGKNICKLCSIVNNFKIGDIYSILLCKSKLSQEEICNKTSDYFIKNNKFPTPFDIDEKCKIINYSVYKFIRIFSSFSDENKKKFSKYKIFFTPESLPTAIKSLFNKQKIESQELPENFIFQKYNLKKKKLNILDKIFYETPLANLSAISL